MQFFLIRPLLFPSRWIYCAVAFLPLTTVPAISHAQHSSPTPPSVQPKSGPQHNIEHAPHSGSENPRELRHQANALVRLLAHFGSEEAPPAVVIPGDYSSLPLQPQVQYSTDSVQVNNKSKYALDVLIRWSSDTRGHGEHPEVQRFEASESQAFSRTSTELLEASAFWPGQYLEASAAQSVMSDQGASGNTSESSEVSLMAFVAGFVLGLLVASGLLFFFRRKSIRN